MGIIKTIIVIVVIYYLLKFFSRLTMPYLIKKVVNKAAEQAQGQGSRETSNYKKEGEVTVEMKEHPTQKYNADEGEYVDFEEIKDNKST